MHCQIESYVNSWVIRSLDLRECGKRNYQLGGAGLVFKIDKRLADIFTKCINEMKLKLLIQKEFKGVQLHKYDTNELGYLSIGSIPIVWHITNVNKDDGKLVKTKHFQHQHINFVVTVYKATDFAKLSGNQY